MWWEVVEAIPCVPSFVRRMEATAAASKQHSPSQVDRPYISTSEVRVGLQTTPSMVLEDTMEAATAELFKRMLVEEAEAAATSALLNST